MQYRTYVPCIFMCACHVLNLRFTVRNGPGLSSRRNYSMHLMSGYLLAVLRRARHQVQWAAIPHRRYDLQDFQQLILLITVTNEFCHDWQPGRYDAEACDGFISGIYKWAA
jgi:hypothetical protein